MENNKKEILERLDESCQIPLNDRDEQLEIIDNQEKEISQYKNISITNLNKIKMI